MPSKWIKAEPIFPPEDKWVGNQLENAIKNIEKYLKGDASKILLGDMEATTENWSEPPNFVSEYSEPYGTRKEIYVHPKGKGTTNWQRISGGVKGRTITAKRAPVLAFKEHYSPKTRPGGRMYWGGPGARSGPYRRAKSVEWPGIEPRKFSEEIVKERETELKQGVQTVINKAFK